MRGKSFSVKSKNVIPAISVSLLLIGNEVVSLAVLTVLAFIGIAKLFGAMEAGDW